jgi:hypothetical protein
MLHGPHHGHALHGVVWHGMHCAPPGWSAARPALHLCRAGSQPASPRQAQAGGLRGRLANPVPYTCRSVWLSLNPPWQAESGDLRERLADARRQRQADEEMISWLNTQARACAAAAAAAPSTRRAQRLL